MDVNAIVTIIGAVAAAVVLIIREMRTTRQQLKGIADDVNQTHIIVNSQRTHLLELNALYRKAFLERGMEVPEGNVEQPPA